MSTCELLIGMPALVKMSAMIDAEAGTMTLVDDDGNVQIFGKNRSQIVDIVGYIAAVEALRW